MTPWPTLCVLLPRDRFRVREEKSIEPWVDGWGPSPTSLWCAASRPITSIATRGRPTSPCSPRCATPPSRIDQKLAGYAEAGFPVYWILDLGLRQLEVYSGPIAGEYQAPTILGETEFVELVIEGEFLGQIAVADLLP